MSFRVIVDSCGELTQENEGERKFCHCVADDAGWDDEIFVDDETFDQKGCF